MAEPVLAAEVAMNCPVPVAAGSSQSFSSSEGKVPPNMLRHIEEKVGAAGAGTQEEACEDAQKEGCKGRQKGHL